VTDACTQPPHPGGEPIGSRSHLLMTKRMLIDAAHPEETRVVVINNGQLEDFEFESSTKKQLKGNIYLAKVTRVEPSLQAAFVDYGGQRHGFLAFSEIHPDYYQVPQADRRMLDEAERQVAEVAEGNGAAEEAEDGAVQQEHGDDLASSP
jgi:ribonuclease E